mmetsp:Transcript_22224/g.48806  ORF Transcript_22224/g.48806 Transcript_22224/m.48806 type:complete len:326 (-) Transcript_22224:1263-2240(-)
MRPTFNPFSPSSAARASPEGPMPTTMASSCSPGTRGASTSAAGAWSCIFFVCWNLVQSRSSRRAEAGRGLSRENWSCASSCAFTSLASFDSYFFTGTGICFILAAGAPPPPLGPLSSSSRSSEDLPAPFLSSFSSMPPHGRESKSFVLRRKLAVKEPRKGSVVSMNRMRGLGSRLKKSVSPISMSVSIVIRHDRKPDHSWYGSPKNALKKKRVFSMLSFISVSIPKHMKVRSRRSCLLHTFSHTSLEKAVPFLPSSRASATASTSTSAELSVLDTMKPVDGCTMPAVPPIPRVRWGKVGSTPPMGMRQYSSSSMQRTLMPRLSSR